MNIPLYNPPPLAPGSESKISPNPFVPPGVSCPPPPSPNPNNWYYVGWNVKNFGYSDINTNHVSQGCNVKGVKIIFPVWLWNRLVYSGLKPVIRHTEKSCTASYYRQFSSTFKIKIKIWLPVLGENKNGFNLIIFHFRGTLSIIPSDK